MAKPTLYAVIKRYCEFVVMKNKGSLSFSRKANHHVGGTTSEFEVKADLLVEAKQ